MIATKTTVMSPKNGESPTICLGPFDLPELSKLFPMSRGYLQHLDRPTQGFFSRPPVQSIITRWRKDRPDTTYYGVYLGDRPETSKFAGLVTATTVSISDIQACGCDRYLGHHNSPQEVGVIISERMSGRGLGKAALQCLIGGKLWKGNTSFHSPLAAELSAENQASARLLSGLGFIGTCRHPGIEAGTEDMHMILLPNEQLSSVALGELQEPATAGYQKIQGLLAEVNFG